MNNEHSNIIIQLLKENAYKKDISQVFMDYLAISAISIRNSMDKSESLEKQYLDIVGTYSKEEINRFVKAFACLVTGLEEKPDDILGTVFHGLELHDTWKGQFFTPIHISQMMSSITGIDSKTMENEINKKGYVTVCEPCCGSGVMVIAFSENMRRNKLNPQQQMFSVCTDIDLKCVHMTYVQLSLLGIPAQVIHGNSLTSETFSVWNTPLLYMNPKIILDQFNSSKQSIETQQLSELQNVSASMSVNSVNNENEMKKIIVGEQISLFDAFSSLEGNTEEQDEDLEM